MLGIELRTQSLQLSRSVHNSRQRWDERRSTCLALVQGDWVGRGEATPLPGFSLESHQSAHHELMHLDPRELTNAIAGLSAPQLLDRAHARCDTASARFALECALLDLHAKRHSVSRLSILHELTHDRFTSKPPDTSSVRHDAESLQPAQLLDIGALPAPPRVLPGCYKLKLGAALQNELRMLRDWQPQLTNDVQLRFDFNRSVNPAELQAVLEHLAELHPQFVEELCAVEDLGPPRSLPVTIAFDESLLGAEPGSQRAQLIEAWIAATPVVLVVKPMLLGGIKPLQRWADSSARALVVSHLFDGSIAAGMYDDLAKVFGSPGLAMGLGTHPGLQLWQSEPNDAEPRLVGGTR